MTEEIIFRPKEIWFYLYMVICVDTLNELIMHCSVFLRDRVLQEKGWFYTNLAFYHSAINWVQTACFIFESQPFKTGHTPAMEPMNMVWWNDFLWRRNQCPVVNNCLLIKSSSFFCRVCKAPVAVFSWGLQFVCMEHQWVLVSTPSYCCRWGEGFSDTVVYGRSLSTAATVSSCFVLFSI